MRTSVPSPRSLTVAAQQQTPKPPLPTVAAQSTSRDRQGAVKRAWLLAALLACPSLLRAVEPLPAELEGVGIEEKLGAQVDLNLTFTAENGYPVPLKQFFAQGKPVLLNLVYYECPMLCNLILNAQTSTLREIPWTPGREFEIVTISINPAETFELAARKKQSYLTSYDRPAPGWHFLADHQGNAKRLADQVGFHYRWDAKTEQFAHAATIMFLTPEGRVSRYLYGIRFPARDVRLAITEASQSKLALSVDRLLLYCFHYDPQARSYVLAAGNVMRGGGVLIVVVLGFVLWRLWRFERRLAI